MKFSPVVVMPASSVREWLDHELEVRGIDAVIYTRYILSILQHDRLEPCERDFFPVDCKKKENVLGKAKGKNKQKTIKGKLVDCEELKKTAAVECLMSVTEQKCGIKELVEELCARLKSIQYEGYSAQDRSEPVPPVGTCDVTDCEEVFLSNEELAEKYYAAFPALRANSVFAGDNYAHSSVDGQLSSVWDQRKAALNSKSSKKSSNSSSQSSIEDGVYAGRISTEESSSMKNKFSSDVSGDGSAVPLSRQDGESFKLSSLIKQDEQIMPKRQICTSKLSPKHAVCEPAFIVPKCTYRVIKDRSSLPKEGFAFRMMESRTKCPLCKQDKSDKNCCQYCTNIVDNDCDSSFEDGEPEEAVLVASCPTQLLKVPGKAESRCGSHAANGRNTLSTLEAKFNENLAAIWVDVSEENSSTEDFTNEQQQHYSTNCLSWIASLHRNKSGYGSFVDMLNVYEDHVDGRKLCSRDGRFAAFDGSCANSGFGSEQSSLWTNSCSSSSSEVSALKNEDTRRIWKCGGHENCFIKGGVYGFEKQEGKDGEKFANATKGHALDTCSPAFDSDCETLLENRNHSALLRNDDLRLICDMLGNIGNSMTSVDACRSYVKGQIMEECSRQTEDHASVSVGGDQPDSMHSWKVDRGLAAINAGVYGVGSEGCEDEPVQADYFLWGGSPVVDELQSMSNISEEAFRVKLRVDESNFNLGPFYEHDGHGKLEYLVAKNNINNKLAVNTEELLKMTRSYDSYLNTGIIKEEFEENNLSKYHEEAIHHSDPVLFGKKCTLTHHKGESLFVEVASKKERNTLPYARQDEDARHVDYLNNIFIQTSFRNCYKGTEYPLNLTEVCGAKSRAENLLISPLTHFRPIRQISHDSEDTSGSVGGAVQDASSTEVKESMPTTKYPTVCGSQFYERDNCSQQQSLYSKDADGLLNLKYTRDTNGDGDKHYVVPKNNQEKKTDDATGFIPKFKLRPDMEKFCQTEDVEGGFSHEGCVAGETFSHRSENGCSSNSSGQCDSCQSSEVDGNSKMLSGVCHLKQSSFASGSLLQVYNIQPHVQWNNNTDGMCPLDREVMESPLPSEFRYDTYNVRDLYHKQYDDRSRVGKTWSFLEDLSEGSIPSNLSGSWMAKPHVKHLKKDLGEKDFWAVADCDSATSDSEDLKSLKAEIKKDEDELFEDINHLHEYNLHGEWTGHDWSGILDSVYNDGKTGVEWPSTGKEMYQEAALDYQEDEDCPELEMINGGGDADDEKLLDVGWSQCDNVEELPFEDSGYSLFKVPKVVDGLAKSTTAFAQMSLKQAMFATDLEEKWVKSESCGNFQDLKRNCQRPKISGQWKPCSYFMEGSCRRIDCKFSHDLASITCRFWEEGSCFKGVTCPFLHGYARVQHPLVIVNKANKEKNYQLESELDFPSLSKSVESTSSGSWIQSAISLKRKKKRNRSRVHETFKGDNVVKHIESI